jgi:hypothetical protein
MVTSGIVADANSSWLSSCFASLPTNLAAGQAVMVFPPWNETHAYNLSKETSAIINTFQPLVNITCYVFNSTRDDWIYYKMQGGSRGRLKTIAELNKQLDWREQVEDVYATVFGPSSWMVAPDDPASLVVSLPEKNRNEHDGNWYYNGRTCTLSSYWWRTDAFLDVLSDPRRVRLSSKRPDLADSGAIKMTSDLRPVTIDPSNIEFLHSANFTFEVSGNPITLAWVWVATLASIPAQQEDRYSRKLIYMSNAERNASKASYTITTVFHGFGYGPTDTASKLAAAVIATYCLISFLFIAYIITTGHTSIAWDSAMELIVLALQSKEPDGLGHVSVGLDFMDTFRKTVGIRVNTVPVGNTGETRERLEMIFEHDEDTEKRGLTKVVRNTAY